MRKFAYKELDQEGLETLQTISEAHRFNEWMFETILPYVVEGPILEVGSGIGNISSFFLERGMPICLSDIRENYCGFLEEKFSQHPQLIDILQLDLVHPQFETEYAEWLGHFHTVYALNVVEHIEDDGLALANIRKLLAPKGRVIILVPAYQMLYNTFDKNLYHYRRYTKSTLSAVFEENSIPVLTKFHFNFIGIFGWILSGSILKKETIPSGQMKLYDTLVPIFRLIDRLLLKQIGLSVIAIGEN
ncbi:MAG: class I SAM-dependent methyltransferase [Bacteroidota bacterium]